MKSRLVPPAGEMPLAFPATPCQAKKSIGFIWRVKDSDWCERASEQ
jgi:hypothetical protein